MRKEQELIVQPEAIGGTLEAILKAVIDLSKLWINRIKDDYARETLNTLAETFKEVIAAIADTNPDDKEQIKAIISKFLTDTDFVDNTKAELLALINELKDDRLKTVLFELLPVFFDIIKMLFDEDGANEEQIKERLIQLLKSSNGLNVLTALIHFVVKDENLARTIAGLILSLVGSMAAYVEQKE
jgi:hypothetical protein